MPIRLSVDRVTYVGQVSDIEICWLHLSGQACPRRVVLFWTQAYKTVQRLNFAFPVGHGRAWPCFRQSVEFTSWQSAGLVGSYRVLVTAGRINDSILCGEFCNRSSAGQRPVNPCQAD